MTLQDAMAAANIYGRRKHYGDQHSDDTVLRGKVHGRRIRALPAAEQPAAVMEHVGLKYTKGAPAHPP